MFKEAEGEFLKLKGNDPIIKIGDDVITIYPQYLNYRFVTSVIGILVPLFMIVFIKLELGLLLLFITLVIVFFYLFFWRDLMFYNKIIIDLKTANLEICPNILHWLRFKKVSFPFREIEKLTFFRNAFYSNQARYNISMVLKNDKKISLLNTSTEQNAILLSNAFKKLL